MEPSRHAADSLDVAPVRPRRRTAARTMLYLALLAIPASVLVPGTVSAQAAMVVRDAAETAGEPVVVLDPGGTLATVEVTTTMDAACALVFGLDETLGRLALDADMGAAAHSDHRVVIDGLEPDTGYVFRFQGSGIDGNLYQSRLYSFRTPAAAAVAPDLAIGAQVVEVSSEYSAAYAATDAVDGDLSTEWSSQGDGDDAFITIDLRHPVDVTGVAFRTRQMSDGTATTLTFTLVVDGQVFGPFPAGSAAVPVALTGQVLRFDVDTSTGGNTGAAEIEVFGAVKP